MQGKEDLEEEEEREAVRLNRQIMDVIEEEMKQMIHDDQEMVIEEMNIIGRLKKMMKEEDKQEDVLQTRIVSPREVAMHWEDWLPATDSEVNSLLEEKEALKRLSKEELEALREEAKKKGQEIEYIPSKVVYTLKPGEKGGKRKVRWVVCGNHETKKEDEETFSTGADAITFRIMVWVCARHQWVACTLDIKTAFLNAMFESKENEGVIVIKPPSIFVEKKYMEKDTYFQPLKAVYGFRRSPRLWTNHRDVTLRDFRIPVLEGKKKLVLRLIPLESEPNLWKVIEDTEEDEEREATISNGRVRGLMMSYVDDLFICGPLHVVEALKKKIEETWTTSPPEWVERSPVRFLGMEVRKTERKEGQQAEPWLITQESYLSEMLKKEEDLKERKIPISREQACMEEDKEPPTAEDVRKCQKEVGELLWVVTRTRPDAMFSVARMGANMTKATGSVMGAAKQLKGYLLRTKKEGLEYEDKNPTVTVHAYSDASFAPESEESHGSFVIFLNDCPMFWRSGRQSTITLSTAESELNELVESMVAAESMSVIVEELYDSIQRRAWCDNQAALSIITTEGGSWRTRHLRLKAAYARGSVYRGEWSVGHVNGENMCADIGTKALTSPRLEKLKQLLKMKGGEEIEEKKEEEEEGKKEDKEKEEERRYTEEAEKALKVIMILAAVNSVKGCEQDEGEGQEEGKRELFILTAIYTILVLLVFMLIERAWNQWKNRQRPIQEDPETRVIEEEIEGEDEGIGGDAGLAESQLVQLPPGGRAQQAGGEPAQLPPQERGEEDAPRPREEALLPEGRAREEEINLEEEWDEIFREEARIRAEIQREDEDQRERRIEEVPQVPHNDRDVEERPALGFPVYITRHGQVYHINTGCNYLTAAHVGPARFSNWCPTCRRISENVRGRPPPGVILYIDHWGAPVHTDFQCPRRRTTNEYRACQQCMRGVVWAVVTHWRGHKGGVLNPPFHDFPCQHFSHDLCIFNHFGHWQLPLFKIKLRGSEKKRCGEDLRLEAQIEKCTFRA